MAKSINEFNEYFCDVSLNEFDENADFEIVRTGKLNAMGHGDFEFKRSDLEEMAKNFNEDITGLEIAVDLNHDPEKKAFAWIKPGSMFVGPSRKTNGEFSLFAQLHRFTPEGKHLLETGAFRFFSIQLRNSFQKFVDGVKKTFNNVIMGLALTNLPAVKGMAPTFSESTDSVLFNPNNMDVFNIYLSELAKKETVSKEEKELLNTMYLSLSEEEQAEAKEGVEEVQEKPEEAEAPAEEESEEAPAEEAAEEAEESTEETPAEEAPEEEAPAEEKELAEKVLNLSEKNESLLAEVVNLKDNIRTKNLSEKVEKDFLCSEKNKVGFLPKCKDELVSFFRELSDSQVEKFGELFSSIRSVDLSEHGFSGAVESDTDKKAMKLAEERAKESDKPFHEVLADVYRELNSN